MSPEQLRVALESACERLQIVTTELAQFIADVPDIDMTAHSEAVAIADAIGAALAAYPCPAHTEVCPLCDGEGRIDAEPLPGKVHECRGPECSGWHIGACDDWRETWETLLRDIDAAIGRRREGG